MDECALITSSAENTGYIICLKTGSTVEQLKDLCSPPGGTAAVSPLGTSAFVVSANIKGTSLSVWRLPSGTSQPRYRCHAPEKISAVALSPDGAWCVGGGASGKVYLWETATGSLLVSWEAHYSSVTVLQFSRDGGLLLSGGNDAIIACWNLLLLLDGGGSSPPPLWTTCVHALPVTGLQWGPGGNRIYSSCMDRTTRVWEASNGALVHTVVARESLLCVACDCEEDWLFLGGGRGTIFAVGLGGGAPMPSGALPELRGHDGAVTSLQCSYNDLFLISTGEDGSTRLWDTVSGQCLRVVELFSSRVPCSQALLPHAIYRSHGLPTTAAKEQPISPFRKGVGVGEGPFVALCGNEGGLKKGCLRREIALQVKLGKELLDDDSVIHAPTPYCEEKEESTDRSQASGSPDVNNEWEDEVARLKQEIEGWKRATNELIKRVQNN